MHELELNIRSWTVIKIILIGLFAWALFALRDVVLIILTAVVIASALEPAVRRAVSWRIPRVFAVLAVYVFLGTLLAALFYVFAPLFLEEVSTLLTTLPEHLGAISVEGQSWIPGNIAAELSISDFIQSLQTSLSSTSAGLLQTASAIFGGLIGFILVVVFSFYFAVQETGVEDFLRIVTPKAHEERVLGIWKRSQHKIGLWMQGQLLLAVFVGILVYLGLTVIGVQYALLLGILAAIFELIPVFGPVLAAVPAVALASEAGVTVVLLVIGYFIIVQQFENHLLYPLVVTKVVGVPPLIVIIALIVGAKLAGFLGIILSVPAAAVVQELVQEFRSRSRAASETLEA